MGANLILKRLPSTADGRSKDLVRELLKEAGVGLRPALEELEVAMLRHVAAVTSPQFAAIRAIPAQYRMLNKPVPTKASPYVESSAGPIRAFQEAAARAAPAATVAAWVQKAVDAAAVEFSTQAAQLLESTKQQEASLRRLAGRGTGGEAAQVSDLDKIHIQLCLDVETFAGMASTMGAAGPGLQKLAEVVAPVRPTFEAHRPPA